MMMSTTLLVLAPRRSKRSTAGKRQERLHVSNLSSMWRRHYLDMNHCRLQKCVARMRNASNDDISNLSKSNTSFLAMAISAASAYGVVSKQNVLLEYAHAIAERGLDINDKHNGNTALVLACYHGYHELALYLVELGASLDSHGSYGNAVEASVRNGQHQVLMMLLELRPRDVSALFRNDAFSTPLWRLIFKKDVESLCILTTTQGIIKPTMNNEVMDRMKCWGEDKRYLHPVLQQLYPFMPNVASWNKEIHWSFPTSDRQTLNLLWYSAGVMNKVFPTEIWLLIFSFTGRGWFAKETRRVGNLSIREMW